VKGGESAGSGARALVIAGWYLLLLLLDPEMLLDLKPERPHVSEG